MCLKGSVVRSQECVRNDKADIYGYDCKIKDSK